VLLEVENDEVDHLRHDPDRNLRRGRCCDRKVIDVQHQLRQRPITISDNYNVDEKESQLRRGRPGPRRDATSRNKQAGKNTLDPNHPLHAISGQRKPEEHQGVALAGRRDRKEVVRYPLERLDQVKERDRVLLRGKGRRLSTERHCPGRPLRTHASTSKQLRHRMRGLPGARLHGASAHPQPDDGWEKPNGPEPPVRLRQEHNEDKTNRLPPSTKSLGRSQNARKRHQCLIREPG
jgi:hypothetical protein